MLQIVGSVLVIAGCSGLGFWYRSRLICAVQCLRELREVMESLMSEINYHKATLPEACRQVGKRVWEPYKSSLICVYEAMNKNGNIDFREAWRREMETCICKMPLSEKEKEMVFGFAESGTHSDYRMQIRSIEQCRNMLDNAIHRRETEMVKQGKMAAGLGIMGGLLLVLILF